MKDYPELTQEQIDKLPDHLKSASMPVKFAFLQQLADSEAYQKAGAVLEQSTTKQISESELMSGTPLKDFSTDIDQTSKGETQS